jgi:hypothetical protein
MSQPAIVPAASESRRWVPAILGGVLLGEALWALLHLLVRDWAVPAIINATGQGPTRNQGAFEPLPLLIAFVEACVAGIVLAILMAWSRRGTRVVTMVRAAAPGAAVPSIAPATAETPAVAPVAARPVAPVAVTPAPVASVPVAATSMAATPAIAVQSMEPIRATPVMSAAPPPPAPAPVAAAPVRAAAEKPQPPPKPKKPKPIYYNSVGEPVESDD